MFLFSYGSNSPEQLSDRLGRRVTAQPAVLHGMRRVFRGASRGWGGAPASLIRKPGSVTYGNVVSVTEDQLRIIDRYEGVGSGQYRRIAVKVQVKEGRRLTTVDAVAYVATSRRRGRPTQAYLQAVADNVGQFWSAADGSALRPEDFFNEE